MDQFVLVPISVYNNLNTKPLVTQDLPKYQPLQTPTSQTDSLKKEINKGLFHRADTLVDKFLSSPRIKISSSSSNIFLDGRDTGLSLKEFARNLRLKKAAVPDIYFTLLNAAEIDPSQVVNENAKAQERGNWIPFEI